jgi:arginyl-tRNA--protein-N-Asp/Glu arginylyltransferase
LTQYVPTRQLRFFLTGPSPCPYLPGREERKVFTHLPMSDGAQVNDALTQVGFRRSQNIAYRPACEQCSACVSARIPVANYVGGRSHRRILRRNADLVRSLVEPEATIEQFDLLQRYLLARHPGGGMTEMSWLDYVAMVEDSSVRTHLIEYRAGDGRLVAAALTDLLSDGLSLVYSFFDPDLGRRSLGQFVVLDHLRQARIVGLEHVYLGYWVRGSAKMDYKARFRPLQTLRGDLWTDESPLNLPELPEPEPRKD